MHVEHAEPGKKMFGKNIYTDLPQLCNIFSRSISKNPPSQFRQTVCIIYLEDMYLLYLLESCHREIDRGKG